MTPERWQQITAIFHAALAREPLGREAFLAEACEADATLRSDVDAMLAGHEGAGQFGELPLLTSVSQLQPDSVLGVAPLAIGSWLGPYQIRSLLGAGGMGQVYKAVDPRLHRDVAIKVLPPVFTTDPDRLARFEHEARVLAALNHPHIGAIYGLEEAAGIRGLVLELVEGSTLADRLTDGPVPLAEVLSFGEQIAEALEAAHSKGIIHRDLKPANVKVTPDGRIKVLDFGLAKAIWGTEERQDLSQLSTVTRLESVAGRVVGTPPYMSPEQARGSAVDERTDIWAFGCLLYELLTGKRAFQGETLSDTIRAVLEREPDWSALPARTHARIRELLRQCLQKDGNRRLPSIADARRTIEEAQRGWNRWRVVAVAAVALAALAIGAALWPRAQTRPADRSEWVQLTKMPDSVSQPTLSPDGRILAFIRGASTFFGAGEIYIKILPDGEPKQLTHDSYLKMSPAFSPDGARIAYTTLNPRWGWDTWVVPVLGGEPQPLLRNASGLLWTGPRQVLFSELKMGVHMGLVTAEESRIGARDIYLPADEPAMAHRSYLSPDGKWVLVVEMDQDHLWLPCRLVPMDGSGPGRRVGPERGGCTVGAWSPDGKWMYFTANPDGANHIWRQRFPDGELEQMTSGPTEEEGIAIAPDGHSFVTAVALQNTSLWVHDAQGERQISLEGNGARPKFTPDGKKLCYLIVREAPSEFGFYRDPGELRVADLETGRSEPVVGGLQVLDYDISADDHEVVMWTTDREGKNRLWLAPFDRSAPPRQIPNVEGGYPRFGPSGEIFFRRLEGKSTFVYRVRPDGTGLRKALEQSILALVGVSRDGRWIESWAPLAGNGPPAYQLYPLEGGPSIPIHAFFGLQWTLDGRSAFITGGQTYVIPLPPGEALPRIPAGGFHSEEEIAHLPGARRLDVQGLRIDTRGVVPGRSADVYAFYRGTTQRNLYRIPIK
jgi:serine/threonine protein kinase